MNDRRSGANAVAGRGAHGNSSAAAGACGLWVYGVVSGPARAVTGQGITGEALRCVSGGGVLAVVGEASSPPVQDGLTLDRHDRVMRGLTQSVDAMLPLRWGVAVRDEGTLAAWLETHGPRLVEALAAVNGCDQMTLRVYGDPFPTVVPGVTALGETSVSGRRYMTARLVARASAHAVPEIEPLRGALAGLVQGERVEQHVLPPLVASVFHLVHHGSAVDYCDAVSHAGAMLGTVRVTATGPEPPYAFMPETDGLLPRGMGLGSSGERNTGGRVAL